MQPFFRFVLAVTVAVLTACASSSNQTTETTDTTEIAPGTGEPTDTAMNTTTTAFTGTRWKLTQLGSDVVSSAGQRQEPFVRFAPDSTQMNGFSGCNRFFGTYATTGDSLIISGVGSTKMACPDMQTETRFMTALQAAKRYELSGSTLMLYAADSLLATFEPMP